MFKFLESLIYGTRVHKAVTPPAGLLSFYWHFIEQTQWFYVAMLVGSLSVVLVDISIPVFFGKLVGSMTSPDPVAALAAQTTGLWIMLVVVLALRPLIQFADTALRLNALIPGATTLMRWQSHWHIARQSWPFFQKDFSGRIANRVMQTAQSLRESVMWSIRVVLYFLSYGIFTLVLVFGFDWRLSVPTLMWLLTYAFFLRFFVPRLRDLSKQSSDAGSMVMSRVVDSYTNILTVKLFARAYDEDAYVREVMDAHQVAIAQHMRMTTRFEFTLQILNALLLVSTAAIGLSLWRQGLISTSQLATA